MGFSFVRTQQHCSPKNILQYIVRQNTHIHGTCELYIHHEKLENGYIHHKTDTYVNIFHFARWHELTGINNIALEVTCYGHGKLFLYGIEYLHSKIIKSANLTESTINCQNTEIYTVNLTQEYDFYYFSWEDTLQKPLIILNAVYIVTEKDSPIKKQLDDYTPTVNCVPDNYAVKIALVIPTYRRIDAVTTLINIYKKACSRSSSFAKSSHLFLVNNDITTKKAFHHLSDAHLTVLHNPANMGGAGGFCRGAEEALKTGAFSHILFMDDDACPHEETWFRTLALLRHLRPPYKDQIISGAMFTMEQPTWCHAMQEAMNQRGGHVMISGERDVSSPQAVLELISKVSAFTASLNVQGSFPEKRTPVLRVHPDAPERPYAAWWYCAIPAELFRESGYPLPVFFRGDDQEFGMRVRRLTLPLNGVCVWHRAFSGKQSLLRTYLGVRNHAITNVLHFQHWRSNLLRQLFFTLASELAANRYPECAARILAFRDFLRFDRVPREGELLVPRVNLWCERFRYAQRDLPSRECVTAARRSRRSISVMAALLVYLTLGGALTAPFLRKRSVRGSRLRLVNTVSPCRTGQSGEDRNHRPL